MLTDKEMIRYSRQILLEDWGTETQNKLKSKTVFVAGAGGSGSPIITQLALLGVGCIRICDYDEIELSNLNRQFIHCISGENRIGLNKATSAKMTIKNINPNIEVEIFLDKIDKDNVDKMIEWSVAALELLKGYHKENKSLLDEFAFFPSNHLSLVRKDGALDLYHGVLRAIDAEGKKYCMI